MNVKYDIQDPPIKKKTVAQADVFFMQSLVLNFSVISQSIFKYQHRDKFQHNTAGSLGFQTIGTLTIFGFFQYCHYFPYLSFNAVSSPISSVFHIFANLKKYEYIVFRKKGKILSFSLYTSMQRKLFKIIQDENY